MSDERQRQISEDDGPVEMTAARVDRDVVSLLPADLRAAGRAEVVQVHGTIDQRFKLIEEGCFISV